jgi:hypothetical protein
MARKLKSLMWHEGNTKTKVHNVKEKLANKDVGLN